VVLAVLAVLVGVVLAVPVVPGEVSIQMDLAVIQGSLDLS
jgi:hypothetical protein